MISVLSAVECLKIIRPASEPYALPLHLFIIGCLSLVCYHGTSRVTIFFGPMTLVWIVAMAAVGITNIISAPSVLWSFNPPYAVSFLSSYGIIGLCTLGAVFLAVRGVEALYADFGHF